ncbi:TPA: hypothetical protein ACN6VZ_002178 [Morganella morganii]|uniref:hypothetical protein n=1 Tax=Morganella morganii TaxID=582 RepID=UPI0034D5189D
MQEVQLWLRIIITSIILMAVQSGLSSHTASINPIYYAGGDYKINLINNENCAGAYVTLFLNINGNSIYIPFNREPVDIGSVNTGNSSASFSYPITYNLYSRKSGITGKVKGNSELSIVLR